MENHNKIVKCLFCKHWRALKSSHPKLFLSKNPTDWGTCRNSAVNEYFAEQLNEKQLITFCGFGCVAGSPLQFADQTDEQFASEALDRLCNLYSRTLAENIRRNEVMKVLVDWSHRKGISAPMQTPVMQSRIPVETVIEKLKSLYPHIMIDALRFSAEWEEVLKNSNSLIPCIRVIRAHTGLGLKEAVEFCRTWLY